MATSTRASNSWTGTPSRSGKLARSAMCREVNASNARRSRSVSSSAGTSKRKGMV